MIGLKSTNDISINAVGKEELSENLLTITDQIASVLAKTYGPYGQNTLIHSMESVYSTKDGWTVLQNVNFGNDIVVNSLKRLIQDVAQTVLLKVGDGTTTSIIAANEINKRLSTYLSTSKHNSREIENALRGALTLIQNQLKDQAEEITKDNVADVIKRIANVSTNWDTEAASLISEIYTKTGNPIIKYENSGTEKTFAEYVEGFDVIAELLLPEFYINNPTEGLAELNNPLVLIYSYQIQADMAVALTAIASLASAQGSPLVIMAPGYDLGFINALKSANVNRIRAGKPMVNIYPVKYFSNMQIDKDMIQDLCMLTGAQYLDKEDEDIKSLFSDLKDAVNVKVNRADYTEESEYNKAVEEKAAESQQLIQNAYDYITQIGGYCDKLKVNKKYALFSGLNQKNEAEIQKRKDQLIGEIDRAIKDCDAKSMITENIRMKRIRLGKLNCNMGIIKVGGFGDANLKARRDALDDATKACESAFRDGYVAGSGIAIPVACDTVYRNLEAEEKKSLLGETVSIIGKSFIDVIHVMFQNKFTSTEDHDKINQLIYNAIESNTPYNLITDQPDKDLIEPFDVSSEVLNGCMRLVLVNATSNQLLYKQYMTPDDVR